MGSGFITVYPVYARSFALCSEGIFLISSPLSLLSSRLLLSSLKPTLLDICSRKSQDAFPIPPARGMG